MWKNGRRHGRGTHFWKEGDYIDVEWRDGKKHGDGFYRWPSGTVEKGPYVNDEKHGWHIRTDSEGYRWRILYRNGTKVKSEVDNSW